MVSIILLNKRGFAEIKCNKKMNVIKAGFSPTKLVANFINLTDTLQDTISPVWIVECNNIENYDIEENKCGKELLISTMYEHTEDIVKVTLIDKEQNYIGTSIELKVIKGF